MYNVLKYSSISSYLSMCYMYSSYFACYSFLLQNIHGFEVASSGWWKRCRKWLMWPKSKVGYLWQWATPTSTKSSTAPPYFIPWFLSILPSFFPSGIFHYPLLIYIYIKPFAGCHFWRVPKRVSFQRFSPIYISMSDLRLMLIMSFLW